MQYTSLIHRDDHLAIASSTQAATSLSSTASLDNSLSDMYRSPPRPLPYDADPRFFRLQRDGLVSRREKGSSHSHEETEPLRRSEVDEDSESPSTGGKWNECAGVDESKEYNSRSSLKLSAVKTTTGFAHIYSSSSDDEDVCPTCLEEYTTENPKIVTKCSHHFHLGCIYEWMERSDSCPVCGKVMAFDETP
ncbi:OLC1v1009827C4 [Oldenlandia corymbosa var. corymbosa]|uniref:RING-type E3 ubiquitin transferase n=1 Tax=Oldenlandia corymbosa var. corymbosa TaxID=529605 RepID=A0AAV1DPV2_OLDCO|nr:OLC1v1009827C4 [Oldenlandia corymbosa var. corymbosa]